MHTYQALATAFYREKVDLCFALLGDANMHWAGALADLGTRFIYTRHEHAAAAAATSYARASGKVGVATVTCGPGLTQIMTLLPIAVRARIPLVIFAGEAPVKKAWYNQSIDHNAFVEACGAGYRQLSDQQTMIAGVHQAFADARQHQQPIVVGVPLDTQQEPFAEPITQPTSDTLLQRPAPLKPDPSDIEKAANIIAASNHPVVLAGLGATSPAAKSACIALAKHSGSCLATTLPAKGLFCDQTHVLGVAGGYATEKAKTIFAESDLIIGVGARLASHTFDSGTLTPKAKVIHIDIAPQTTVQGRKASDLAIASDATLACEALINALSPKTGWRTSEMQSRAAHALTLPDDHSTPDNTLHPMAVVKQLEKIIPHHCHIVNTSGHCAYYTAQMNNHPQSHYTVIRDFGAIGNGTSFAMGIAAAHPDRPVVVIDGDGSALMHIQELETMHRHHLKILIIVLNDGAYGSEVHKLRADKVSDAGSVFGRPDFSAISTGFGLHGKTFTSLESLQESMQEFLSGSSSALWDIHISDKIASPQILKAHRAAHTNPS